MASSDNCRNYATICRLCLQKEGFMFGIFNHIQGKEKSIYKKIMDCTALQISIGDSLPNVICHRCLYKIEFCLEFRQLCFVSDATLRQLNIVNGKTSSEDQNSVATSHSVPAMIGLDDNPDAVIVVDPNAMDYDSEYETENDNQSDNDNAETSGAYGFSNISMCKYCDQAFMNKEECFEHENTAHNCETPYSCIDCTIEFEDRVQYSAHLKSVHQNDKPFKCPQCERTFARRSDLRKHTIVHTGIKPFTCHVCFKSFSRNTNLSKHLRIHSGYKLFSCTKCPKKFISKSDLTRHGVSHTGVKSFRCSYCHLSFGRKDKLAKHEKEHQDKLKETRDDEDNAEYKNYESAQEHKENKDEAWNSSENMVISLDPFHHNGYDHTGEGLKEDYVNGEYEKTEHNKGIEKNLSTEEDNKLYPCDVCDKRFAAVENLKYHKATHQDNRPFACDICQKSFLRKRELDRHVVTHTGMKPYKCTRCPKSFGRKDKLIRHTRIHDVHRQFGCDKCDATFKRRDGLQQHMKIHAKENEPESLN